MAKWYETPIGAGLVAVGLGIAAHGFSGCAAEEARQGAEELRIKMEMSKWCIENGYKFDEGVFSTRIYKATAATD